MLSLFGWNSGSSDIENNEKCGTIKCTLCNREIGIWNTVDPLNSHRYFCPYRVSNRMPDGVSSKRGFEIVAEAYLRYKKKYSHNNKISDDTTNGEVNNTHVDESISESADINPADALRAVKKAFYRQITFKKDLKMMNGRTWCSSFSLPFDLACTQRPEFLNKCFPPFSFADVYIILKCP